MRATILPSLNGGRRTSQNPRGKQKRNHRTGLLTPTIFLKPPCGEVWERFKRLQTDDVRMDKPPDFIRGVLLFVCLNRLHRRTNPVFCLCGVLFGFWCTNAPEQQNRTQGVLGALWAVSRPAQTPNIFQLFPAKAVLA